MSRSLQYNEDKVRNGVASVLCAANVQGGSLDDINRAFMERERMSVRDLEHVAFHMSVNPGPDDRIAEKDIPCFVQDVMSGLGYADQPWVVFRHEDIDRIHYHVVSIRIDRNGRKIRDYFEKKNCERIVASLERKFNYRKGSGRTESGKQEPGMPVFIQGTDNMRQSVERCVTDSLQYRFTTGRQFAEILRMHGVAVREGVGKADMKIRLSFQGLDPSGRPCTGSISDKCLGFNVQEGIMSRIAECRAMDMRKERSMTRTSLSQAMDAGASFKEVIRNLRTMHIDAVVYRDRRGKPRAVTLIDHRIRCAFGSSEVSRNIGARLLALAEKDGTSPAGRGGDEPANDANQYKEVATGVTDTLMSYLALLLHESMYGSEQAAYEKKLYRKKRRRQ